MVLLALGLAAFCGALNVVVLGPFLPAIARDLDIGVPLLGQAPALANVVAACLGLAIGPLADRYGQRRTLVLGLLCLLVSGLGSALAPGYLVLLAAVLVAAPARSIAMPVAQAIAGSLPDQVVRRRAVGWTQVGVGASVTLGMPLLAFVGDLLGWRAALAVFGGLGLAAALLARVALPPGMPGADAPGSRLPGPGALLASYRPLLRHRPTLGVLAATVVGNGAISALLTYLGAFLIEHHGASARDVGWAFSLSGAGLIVGGVAGVRSIGRVPARLLALTLMTARGLLILAIFLLPAGLPFGTAIASGLFGLVGLCDGAYIVAVILLLTAETPAGRATTMIVNGSATALGSASGSAIGGALLALGGFGLLAPYPPLAALAASALIWWSGRRT